MKALALVPILAIGLLAGPSSVQADSSAELWLAPGIKYKLADDLKLNFTQDIRFQDDASELQSIMPTLALSYRLHRNVKIATGYRYAYKRTGSGDFSNRHRLHTDGLASYSFGDVKVSYRLRLQSTLKEDETKSVARNRLALQYRMNGTTNGATSVETFHDLSAGFETLRVTVGIEREISGQDVSLFYRYESPSDAAEDKLHILGLGFDLSL